MIIIEINLGRTILRSINRHTLNNYYAKF
jgi:hypothetical protein